MLVLILVAGCATIRPVNVELTPYQSACIALGQQEIASCAEIEAPVVIISQAPLLIGAYGFYMHGEKYVFALPQEDINKLALAAGVDRIPTTEEVVFHETIHYILSETDSDVSRCRSEEIARRLTAAAYGYRYNSGWKVGYGCMGMFRGFM